MACGQYHTIDTERKSACCPGASNKYGAGDDPATPLPTSRLCDQN
jgi:hypothetical protein